MAGGCFVLELSRHRGAQPRGCRRTGGDRQTRACIEGHPREDRRRMDEGRLECTEPFGCPCPRERSFTTFVFRFCRGRISTRHSFARAAGKDRLRGIRSRQELAPAHAAVNTIQAATLTLLVFAIAGMLPAVAITRWSGATPALAILVGACECAVAGTCTLVIGWTLFPWYLLISVLGALLSVPILIRRHRRRAVTERSTRRTSQISWIVTMTALVLTLGACLVPLRVPSVGWDARAIWLLRSSWFLQGHDYLLFAMRDSNPSGLIAHASYPPLVSTAAAISWQVTGTHSERLGVVIVALLNATATLATAWVIVEVGRIAGQQQGQGKRARLAELIARCARCSSCWWPSTCSGPLPRTDMRTPCGRWPRPELLATD